MKILGSAIAAVGVAVCIGAMADELQHPDFGHAASTLYTETNVNGVNEVLVINAERDGRLHLAGRVSAEGLGAGVNLGNQGALALSPSGRHLYVVNARSGDIAVFAINHSGSGLELKQRVSTGEHPISVAVHDDLVYALNLPDPGASANITGFYVDDGRLEPIPNSTRLLSSPFPGPAGVGFNPDGDLLVVTEERTNKIDLYDVVDGVARGPVVHASNGQTPFGFTFDRRGRLYVTEAFEPQLNVSALSTYDVDSANEPLDVISGSVTAHQTDTCWIVLSKDGHFAYVTNTGSGTITGYRVSRSAKVQLLDESGVTASTGGPNSMPADIALSSDGRFVFSLNQGAGTITSYRVHPDGHLTNVSTLADIPLTATGLVAR
jgi:6-phosphogluconolactonase